MPVVRMQQHGGDASSRYPANFRIVRQSDAAAWSASVNQIRPVSICAPGIRVQPHFSTTSPATAASGGFVPTTTTTTTVGSDGGGGSDGNGSECNQKKVRDCKEDLIDVDLSSSEAQPYPQSPAFLSGAHYEEVQKDIAYESASTVAMFNRNKHVRRKYSTITGLFVCFFLGATSESSQTWKRVMNAAISMSGEFSHCELAFRLQDGRYMVCTIHWGGPVQFECKSFNYEKWDIVGLRLDEDQMDTIYDYCLEQQGKPFSKTRIVANFLPFGGLFSWFTSWLGYTSEPTRQQDFFCSELIMRALQTAIDDLKKYNPAELTPTQLYTILRDHHLTSVASLAPVGEIIV